MLMCLDCFKVYNQKTIKNNICKQKDCHGDIVEIDELFVPIVVELNKKGYITKYCCGGHYTAKYPNSYIYFEDNVKLPNLPEGYKYDEDLYPNVDWDKINITQRTTIRILFNKDKEFGELSRDIFNNAIQVLGWVEDLDEFKNLEE